MPRCLTRHRSRLACKILVGLTGRVFLPLGPAGSFDSHITFAADAPVIMPAGVGAGTGRKGEEEEEHIRVYYMGG